MLKRLAAYLLAVPLMVLMLLPLAAQQGEEGRRANVPFILDELRIETRDVFDSTNAVPIVGGLLEHMHAVTKPKVIAQEVFRNVGDTVTRFDLDEIEKNLRNLTLFAEIRFEITPVPSAGGDAADDTVPHAILTVKTRDAWSLRLSGYYNNSQDLSYGASLHEVNFLGFGKTLGLSADYTTRERRGWRYGTSYLNPNIFGTHIQTGGSATAAGEERAGNFYVARPFFSDRTPYAFSTGVAYYYGNEVTYTRRATEFVSSSVPIHRTAVGGWFSSARGEPEGGVFRSSLDVQYNRAFRDGPSENPRAFENSVWVFGGISSRRRSYTKVLNADMDGELQVPVGAMGSVSIGKISPVHGGLDNVAYVGADARQAIRSGNLYGFAAIEAGTGLARKSAQFTSQKLVASGAWLTNPGALVARFEQSTVWNWPRYIGLPLDNGAGLRGYPAGELFGDNKMLLNVDYRLTPLVRVLIFDLGVAAFYDVGSVWRQSEKISQAQFHSSAGVGIRIANANGRIEKGLLRIDFAYNFDEKRLGRIIISSQEAFDFFGNLDYRPPAPYIF